MDIFGDAVVVPSANILKTAKEEVAGMTGREFPIESNAVWLREVLNEKYRIPAYQRPYEWDEKNLDDFLTSIFDGYSEAEETGLSNKPVFFGSNKVVDKL